MNIFPLIGVGTCTTNLSGQILDVRYELIRSKNEDWRPNEQPPLFNPPALYDEGSTFEHLLELFTDLKDLDDDEVKKYIDDWKTSGGNLPINQEELVRTWNCTAEIASGACLSGETLIHT